jgi:hypothetical protein
MCLRFGTAASDAGHSLVSNHVQRLVSRYVGTETYYLLPTAYLGTGTFIATQISYALAEIVHEMP